MKIKFLGIELTVPLLRSRKKASSTPQRSSSATTAMELFQAVVAQHMAQHVRAAGTRGTGMSDQTELHNPIPEYSERLWGQPPRGDILVTDETATMSQTTFGILKEYSHSIPSGKADGKMWKMRWQDTQTGDVIWYLRWYEIKNNQVQMHSRKIVISNWKLLLG